MIQLEDMNPVNDSYLESSWETKLEKELEKEYFKDLSKFVDEEYSHTIIFPPRKDIFKSFRYCPFNNVHVVILGQDPYHGDGQAIGLSFAVDDSVRIPPSLQNIYKEIKSDLGYQSTLAQQGTGNLTYWAKQGVLLLNATLTVRAHEAGSHQGKGWEEFTDAVIAKLSDEREGIVFLLWGRYAKQKGIIIDRSKHLVLEAAHPSPFSAYNGFFGCKHFSQANTYVRSNGKKEIEW